MDDPKRRVAISYAAGNHTNGGDIINTRDTPFVLEEFLVKRIEMFCATLYADIVEPRVR